MSWSTLRVGLTQEKWTNLKAHCNEKGQLQFGGGRITNGGQQEGGLRCWIAKSTLSLDFDINISILSPTQSQDWFEFFACLLSILYLFFLLYIHSVLFSVDAKTKYDII
jgi:hypothetical protein